MTKWDLRFLELARHISTWSKDETQVGCVLVNKRNRVISVGYNGPPQGVIDSYETKDEKLARTIHAEENAILFADMDLTGATAYIYPFYPCSNCAAKLIQVGVKRIVAATDSISRKWNPLVTVAMCEEANVKLESLS